MKSPTYMITVTGECIPGDYDAPGYYGDIDCCKADTCNKGPIISIAMETVIITSLVVIVFTKNLFYN